MAPVHPALSALRFVVWRRWNAPSRTSFVDTGCITNLEQPPEIVFTCTAAGEDCLVCPLPCSGGNGKLLVRHGEQVSVSLPFILMVHGTMRACWDGDRLWCCRSCAPL